MEKIKILLIVLFFMFVGNDMKGQDSGNHEFRFSLGAVFVSSQEFINGSNCETFPPGYISEIYQGDKIGTPGIGLSYSYQFKSWLAFGATLSYIGEFQKKYNLYSDAVHTKHSWNFICMTPTVRFDWFRLNFVKFYSCIGLGFGCGFEQERLVETGRKKTKGFNILSLDLTPLGMTIGRKVFGFVEMGASTHGFMKAGIGYRLNDKSRKQI